MTDDTTASPKSQPRVGGVVIGKNEGERLARALQAVVNQFATTIYVDSNSSDGSRELAEKTGAVVVHLTSGPYTPSRGRQTGLEELVRRNPGLEYVQFIDGDCLLRPSWLETAVNYLDQHPLVGAVFGRRREEKLENFYSRLMDIDWNHPPGEVPNFGGDALIRVGAITDAGGWSADTINAEDIDVSFRIREKGWTIVRLAAEMTLHDARMTRFGEYWRRSVRAGYGYVEVGLRYRHGPGRMLLRRAASSGFYVVVLPSIAVAGALTYWPVALVPAALYARVFVGMRRFALQRGATPKTAAAYASLNIVCKAASFAGALQSLVDHLQGRGTPRDDLIIYRRT